MRAASFARIIVASCGLLVGLSVSGEQDRKRDLEQIANLCRAGELAVAIERLADIEGAPKRLGDEDTVDLAESLNRHADKAREYGRERYADALKLHVRALGIRRMWLGPTDPATADTLSEIARLHHWEGTEDIALVEYKCVIAVRQAAGNPLGPEVADARSRLADLYVTLGLPTEAKAEVQQALSGSISWPDFKRNVAANLLTTQAGLETDPIQRLFLLRQALEINEAVSLTTRDPLNAAISRDNVAVALRDMDRNGEALELFERALRSKEKFKGLDHDTTATTIFNIGLLYERAGRYPEAIALLKQATQISYLSDPSDLMKSSVLVSRLALFSAHLADALAAQGPPEGTAEAIFYYKLSVNARQRMRAGAAGLERAMQEALTDTLAAPYQSLAQLYIRRGRVADAEQVLALLKEAKLSMFLQRNGQRQAAGGPAPMTEYETRYNEALRACAKEWQDVNLDWKKNVELAQLGKIPESGKEWDDIAARLRQAQQKIQQILKDAAARLEGQSKEAVAKLATSFQGQTILSQKLRAIESTAGATRTVGLSYVPGHKEVMVIVTTNLGAVPLTLPDRLSEGALNNKVLKLREAIHRKDDTYRPLAEELYRFLIKPVEDYLTAANMPQTHQLAILSVGGLTALPFSALISPRDGKFLVQRYRLVTLTADGKGGFSDLETMPRVQWRGAGLGTTKPNQSFGNVGLPGVKDEICKILKFGEDVVCKGVEGLISGTRYLDSEFTSLQLRQLFGPTAPPSPNFLHIATHYSAADADGSLLLGDGVLKISTILSWEIEASPYDLIALSACSSGLEQNSVESLGGMFRKQGAKAVIGTLWPVADVGAQALMVEFYRHLGEQKRMSKSQALGEAQIRMIGGGLGDGLKHPYFWAPFILMGNWL